MYTIEIFFIVHIFTIEIFFIIFSASGTSKTKINYLKEKKFFSFLYKKKKKCVFWLLKRKKVMKTNEEKIK